MQAPSKRTLAQFLIENEGQRCVVVLDVRKPLDAWDMICGAHAHFSTGD
jgi:hypothetical protein